MYVFVYVEGEGSLLLQFSIETCQRDGLINPRLIRSYTPN